jgi:hypothetical protein
MGGTKKVIRKYKFLSRNFLCAGDDQHVKTKVHLSYCWENKDIRGLGLTDP